MRAIAAAQRAAIVVHRWLGVALCVLFFTWFTSGIVMLYHGFPEVTPRDRLAHAAPIDAARARISAESAFATYRATGALSLAVLETIDGRPAWRFSAAGADALYADDASPRRQVSEQTLRASAELWAGPNARFVRMTAMTVADQWTLEGALRTMRPLWKVDFSDGQEIYLNGGDASVVQATTSSSRAWAYVGAIPHFLYFAPIRRHRDAWRHGVIALSALATFGALLGVIIGLTRFSPRARFQRDGAPAHIPYPGTKRLHQMIGLTIGVVAVTWAFSGMLSLDPFPPRGPAAPGLLDVAAGALRLPPPDLAPFGSLTIADALHAAGPGVVRLQPALVLGEPMFVATFADGRERFVPLVGAASDSIGSARTIAALRANAGSGPLEVSVLDAYDTYYHDRAHPLPLPVLLVTDAIEPGSRLYVDPRTATEVGRFRPADWSERWLYHGLHSFDLPWLYQRRPLWDIVVILLLSGGVLLSTTSLILAWRVVRRWTIRRRNA